MKNQLASIKSSRVIFLSALLLVVVALVTMVGTWAFATETADASNPDAQSEALPSNDTDSDLAFNSPGGKITISGLCYRLVSDREEKVYENLPGCIIYFDDEQKATSDENGQFSFEVDRYSTGNLMANNSSGKLIKSYYLSANETSTDCYYEFDASIGELTWTKDHYVIVNATNADDTPAGQITTKGTVNGEIDPDYTQNPKGSMYNLIRYSDMPSGAEKNAKIQIEGNKLSYTWTTEGDVYYQEMVAAPHPDFVFEGWYKLRSDSNPIPENEIETVNGENSAAPAYSAKVMHLVRCYSGDYLHDCVEDTFYIPKAAEENRSQSVTDGGYYSYIARFVPKAKTHKITFKVADDSKDFGSIVGTNGNSFNENSNTMQEFSFTETDANIARFFNTGNPLIQGSSAYFLSRLVGAKANDQEDPEFSWISHDTSVTSNYFYKWYFAAVGATVDGKTYEPYEWHVYDKDGNEVSPDEGYTYLCNQNLTFVVSFQATTKITGQVLDENNRPVPNASVSFHDHSNYVQYYAQADQNGKFSIKASPQGGVITAAKNGMSCESVNVVVGQTECNVTLTIPKDVAYITGSTYYVAQIKPAPIVENAIISKLPRPLYDVYVNFYDKNTKKNYTWYVFYDVTPLDNYLIESTFNLPVPKGSEGILTFSHDGFETLSYEVSSSQTVPTEPDRETIMIGKMDLRPPAGLLYRGYIDEENDRVVMVKAEDLSINISNDDPSHGKLLVSNESGLEPKELDYTAGIHFQFGDTIDVDFETGTLTVTSDTGSIMPSKLICTPKPNADENYEFFGWIGYTSRGEEIEIMDNLQITSNMNIVACYKQKFDYAVANGGEGHDHFAWTFNSNELTHIGHEPYTSNDFEADLGGLFRSYVGTKYSVAGDTLTFNYVEQDVAENVIGEPYTETSTLKAVPKDGYTFSRWQLNGVDISDTAVPVVVSEPGAEFNLTAVYTANGGGGGSEDVPGNTAQTSDSIAHFMLITLALLVIGTASVLVARKKLIK